MPAVGWRRPPARRGCPERYATAAGTHRVPPEELAPPTQSCVLLQPRTRPQNDRTMASSWAAGSLAVTESTRVIGMACEACEAIPQADPAIGKQRRGDFQPAEFEAGETRGDRDCWRAIVWRHSPAQDARAGGANGASPPPPHNKGMPRRGAPLRGAPCRRRLERGDRT